MYVHRVTLKNWLRYRGEQTIELQPKVYSVTARRTDNPAMSNMAGKTSFLEAIEFALYGEHRFSREDDFVTRGETDAFVELEMNDGFTIRRERTRGKSTQLIVTDGASRLKKDEAQARIVQRIGLDKTDYRNTAYFQQKMMSRFVMAKPEERMSIIAGWFRLEPLQNAEKNVRNRVRETLDRLRTVQTQIDAKRAYIQANFSSYSVEDSQGPDEMDAILSQKVYGLKVTQETLYDEAKALDAELETLVVQKAEWATAQKAIQDIQRLTAQGKALSEELADIRRQLVEEVPRSVDELSFLKDSVDRSRAEQTKLNAAYTAATKEVQAKKALSQGCFDGACPVNGDVCPVTEKINAPRKRNLEMYDASLASQRAIQEAYNAASADVATAVKALEAVQASLQTREKLTLRADHLEAQRATLRTQYQELAKVAKAAQDVSEAPDDTSVRAKRDDVRKRQLEASTSLEYLTRARQGISEAYKGLEALEQELTKLMTEATVYQEAGQILGRNGAQKRVAEGALAEIEGGANELLKTCGIDLSVGVQWARTGDGLATDCDTCGAPFPASQKVKRCACGAERGPKTVNKLDILLSDRSGGSEDIAGISLQLAASAWLRNDRGSDWSSCVIDEPFGAMDTHNRRAMATHFATMLKGSYGYEQAFIVAHSPDVMDALPGRIEIVADGNGSKLKVVT